MFCFNEILYLVTIVFFIFYFMITSENLEEKSINKFRTKIIILLMAVYDKMRTV